MISGFLLSAAITAAAVGPAPADWSMARRFFDEQRYAEAVGLLSSETMQKLRGKDLESATLTLGRSYERLGKLDKALSVYQLGIKLFPKDISLMAALAQLFQKTNLEERARPLYSRIIELNPHDLSAHLGLAVIDHVLGFSDRSADHYEIVLEQSPSDPGLWRDYAKVLYEMRDFKTAELAIQRSLELQAGSMESVLVQAMILREQGRLTQALQFLVPFTGKDPNIASAYGLWLLEAGRHEDALRAAVSLMSRPETQAVGRWVQALAYLKTGRKALALEPLRALAAGPEENFTTTAAAGLLKSMAGERP